MLLEMRFANFFSIKEEVCIDFKAGNIKTVAAKNLADNIFTVNEETLLKNAENTPEDNTSEQSDDEDKNKESSKEVKE